VAVIADNNIWTTSESGKAKSKQSGFDAIEHWDGSS